MTEAALDAVSPDARARATGPILVADRVVKAFDAPSGVGLRARHGPRVLDDISLAVRRGETLGLVGESGCGKSTLARCLARLIAPTSGRVLFDGVDLAGLDRASLRTIRRRLQIVFQDPFGSLDPRMSAAAIVEEPLAVHRVLADRTERDMAVDEMLNAVGLSAALGDRRPHAFSGGQRQRIAIARALVLNPDVVILDEPVSALDVSVQAQVLNLLRGLQEQLQLTYVFISHDLAVARYFCERIAVLYLGQVMELAPTRAIFASPLHPYTCSLLSAVPVPARSGRARRANRARPIGEVPSIHDRPVGCPFEPRCPVGHGRAVCQAERPPVTESADSHLVACHFPGEVAAA